MDHAGLSASADGGARATHFDWLATPLSALDCGVTVEGCPVIEAAGSARRRVITLGTAGSAMNSRYIADWNKAPLSAKRPTLMKALVY